MEIPDDFLKPGQPMLENKINDFLKGFNASIDKELQNMQKQMENISALANHSAMVQSNKPDPASTR